MVDDQVPVWQDKQKSEELAANVEDQVPTIQLVHVFVDARKIDDQVPASQLTHERAPKALDHDPETQLRQRSVDEAPNVVDHVPASHI